MPRVSRHPAILNPVGPLRHGFPGNPGDVPMAGILYIGYPYVRILNNVSSRDIPIRRRRRRKISFPQDLSLL